MWILLWLHLVLWDLMVVLMKKPVGTVWIAAGNKGKSENSKTGVSLSIGKEILK
jgi:hypothetical protein